MLQKLERSPLKETRRGKEKGKRELTENPNDPPGHEPLLIHPGVGLDQEKGSHFRLFVSEEFESHQIRVSTCDEEKVTMGERKGENEPPDHLLQRPRRTIDGVVGLVKLKGTERKGQGELSGIGSERMRKEEERTTSRECSICSR